MEFTTGYCLLLDFIFIYVIVKVSTSHYFFKTGGIGLKKKTTYVLPDGREFHAENSGFPAVSASLGPIFWMGNSTGVVIGSPVVIPDPEQHPEIISEEENGSRRLLPEGQWPRLNAETPLVRGLAGEVDYSKAAMTAYLNRLHVLGVPVIKN